MTRPSVRILPVLAAFTITLFGPPVITPALAFGIGVFADRWTARHALRIGLAQVGLVVTIVVVDRVLHETGLQDTPTGLGVVVLTALISLFGLYLPFTFGGVLLDLPRAPAGPLVNVADLLRFREAPPAPRRALRNLPAEPTRVDQPAPRLEEPTFVSRFAPRPEDVTEWVRGPGALVAPDSAGR